MTVMVQKEVAERVCTKDGKESLLSLSVKLFGEPKYIKTVKKNLFSPAPKVDSAILLIDNITESPFDTRDKEVLFFEIIRKAFNQKRKQIGKTLKQYELQLKRAKIDLKSRPETISIDKWINLVNLI
jgi:16S rRNA (adenine1518-N6/adenine1519-N6)-dimethyltransferase